MSSKKATDKATVVVAPGVARPMNLSKHPSPPKKKKKAAPKKADAKKKPAKKAKK